MEASSTVWSSRGSKKEDDDENSTEFSAYDDEQLPMESSSRYETRFKQLNRLGRGGYGTVWRCFNTLDNTDYAVKKIAFKETDRSKILREVTAHSRLRHEHIVSYYEYWIENDVSWCDEQSQESDSHSEDYVSTLYIQMELCSGTLKERHERGISKAEAWHFFRQMLEALEHIHSLGIIHRDLNRDNIFLDSSDDIKIGDFGLALLLPGDPNGTVSGTGGVGHAFYRAPEIGRSTKEKDPKRIYSQKVDMYSIGLLFFEILSPPMDTKMERYNLLEDARKLGFENSQVLTPLEISLLKKLLSELPEGRPSATDVLQWKELWLEYDDTRGREDEKRVGSMN